MSEQFWDKSAQKDARGKISDEESYQKKLAETQSYLKPHMKVMEFGCGTGSTAIQHAPYVSHIDATDVSSNMLDIGAEKALAAGIGNIKFTRGTLIDFNAADQSIDVVMGHSILHLVPDRLDTIKEGSRILKPDGIFVSSTACLGDSFLRHIRLITPLCMKLGLMPDVSIFKEAELAAEITAEGFSILSQWNHGGVASTAFIIARKH